MPPLPPPSKSYEDEEEVFQRSRIPSRVAQPPSTPEDHLRAILRLSPPTEKTKPNYGHLTEKPKKLTIIAVHAVTVLEVLPKSCITMKPQYIQYIGSYGQYTSTEILHVHNGLKTLRGECSKEQGYATYEVYSWRPQT